ncbi:unnamed protein product [Caenorhabditis nigoni]
MKSLRPSVNKIMLVDEQDSEYEDEEEELRSTTGSGEESEGENVFIDEYENSEENIEEYEDGNEYDYATAAQSNDEGRIPETRINDNIHESEIDDEDHFESESAYEKDILEDLDYRLLCYVNFVIQERLSNECLNRLDSLMTVLYGYRPMFTKRDVVRVMNNFEERIIIGTSFYCNRCGEKKINKRSMCQKCKWSSKNLLKTTTFVECNMEWQMDQMLKFHGREIVIAHKNIHDNRRHLFQANDIRRHEGYLRNLETKEQYEKGEINLICTYSSDGAQFKRISRREATPVFINLEGLDVTSKKDGKSLCLVALSYSDGGVKKHTIDGVIECIFEQIKDYSIEINLNGDKIVFKLVLMSLLADMKEQALLTSLPNWFNTEGCSKCMTVGTKKTNGKITFDQSFPSRARTDDEMMYSAEQGIHGYSCRRVPIIYSYIPPTIVSIDPFHVRGLGVCKDIIEEFQKPKKWRSLKISSDKLEILKRSIDAIRPYTSEKIKTQSYKKLSKATGREIDKLSSITCAVVGITGSCSSKEFNALFLGLYRSMEFLGTVLASPGSLRLLLYACYKLHVKLERESISLKWHTFYDHLLDHEQAYGHLHTTEIYEREHKSLMTTVHHQTTQCERILISRYIAGKVVGKKISEIVPSYTSEVKTAIVGSLRTNTKSGEDDNYMKWEELTMEHIQLGNELGISRNTRFLKRIHVKSVIGDLQFTAEKYWRNINSTSSVISYIDPSTGVFRFGVIEFMFSHDDTKFIVVREFLLEPLRLTINSWADGFISPEAQEVLDCCLAFPTTLGKIIDHHYALISSSSVLSPAILVSIGGSTYVKICFS